MLCVDVPIDVIWESKLSLLPSRYLRHGMLDHRQRGVPLGELVRLVRPYTGKSDDSGLAAAVIGLPEQERWQPIGGKSTKPDASSDEVKRTYVPGRRLGDFSLHQNDILLAHKGRIGQTALVGAVPTFDEPTGYYSAMPRFSSAEPDFQKMPFITNQSCIALRIKDGRTDPVSLFLFFRSESFQRQIDALRVGSVVSHVTPDEILEGIYLPADAMQHSEKKNEGLPTPMRTRVSVGRYRGRNARHEKESRAGATFF